MIETAITGASVALLNAVREIVEHGNWKPLFLTLSAGVVAAFVTWFAGSVGFEEIKQAFVLGVGGSGVYTLITKAGDAVGKGINAGAEVIVEETKDKKGKK